MKPEIECHPLWPLPQPYKGTGAKVGGEVIGPLNRVCLRGQKASPPTFDLLTQNRNCGLFLLQILLLEAASVPRQTCVHRSLSEGLHPVAIRSRPRSLSPSCPLVPLNFSSPVLFTVLPSLPRALSLKGRMYPVTKFLHVLKFLVC